METEPRLDQKAQDIWDRAKPYSLEKATEKGLITEEEKYYLANILVEALIPRESSR